MISWHKPGQKVVCVKESRVYIIDPTCPVCPLQIGDVFTIASVHPFDTTMGTFIAFALVERPTYAWFASGLFRPVYPQIVEQLAALGARSPERVDDEQVLS